MRQLILVRHAKAEAPVKVANDADRALTLPGRTSAARLAETLAAAGITPDVALVSTAVRAHQTWKIMETTFPDTDVVLSEDLYETHVDGLHAMLTDISAEAQVVVVVGHEPTISATAAWLSGQGSDTVSLQRVAHGLPTGTAACLHFEGDWADLGQRGAQLVHIYASDAPF